MAQKQQQEQQRKDLPTLLLFDVDGTLTAPRLSVTEDMLSLLRELKAQQGSHLRLAIVGGSDFAKQVEQLAPADILELFDYVFSENGLVAYEGRNLLAKQSLSAHLGEKDLKQLINFTLRKLSEVDCPVKRGTFIEFRNGMLNVSPVGRSCSQEERDQFELYDREHQVRRKLVGELEKEFAHLKMRFVIGGQISFDVFPEGWDKTYCLQFVSEKFGDIHFFGDKTDLGGNDHEIFVHERVKGHKVETYKDTMSILRELFVERGAKSEN